MSPVTHFLTGWVVATSAGLNRRGRAVVTTAAVVADVDGLGLIGELLTRHSQHPLLWFSEYHHFLHTLLFAVIVAACAYLICSRLIATAAWAFLIFHVHLLEDLLGSRGPDGFNWPIAYLYPFSRWTLAWSGQWALNSWENLVITSALILATIWLAVTRGTSPVELFSPKADKAVVGALRKRWYSTLH